jgi:uncharacterized protein YaaW (UPF0174 family)
LLTLRQNMLKLATSYNKSVQEESTLTAQELKTRHVGKQDPKRHLEEAVEQAMGDNIVQSLCVLVGPVVWTLTVGHRGMALHAPSAESNGEAEKASG